MSDVSFGLIGPMAEAGVLAAVLGPEAARAALGGARLQDLGRAVLWDGTLGRACLESGPGNACALWLDLPPEGAQRLLRHLTVLGARPGEDGLWSCPAARGWQPWQGGEGQDTAHPHLLSLARAFAAEITALAGLVSDQALAGRRDQLAGQIAAALRAGSDNTPARLRHQPEPVDVQRLGRSLPYQGFFGIEEITLRHRRFSGQMSQPIHRAVFVPGDAVVVLPYDPTRGLVALVEQFRPGPLVRKDRNPWQLEAIAGRIDPGETPEEAARREAIEEAGLSLDRLVPIPGYYPSPGTSSERHYAFLALAALSPDQAGEFGLEEEGEDIRLHVLGLEAALELAETGEIGNAPSLVCLYWLARHRQSLDRAEGGA